MKIIEKEVEAWLGSDTSIEECVSIITDIANGEYKVTMLKKDIESYGA